MPCRNGLDRSCRSSEKCGKWCTYRVRQVGWRLGARSSDRCLFSALSPASVSSRVRCDPAASGLHQDGRGGKGPWEGLETPGQYQTAKGSGFKYKVPHPTDGRSAGNRWVTGRGRISGAVDARDLLLLPAGPPLQPPGGWCARARRHGVLTLKRF